jgi:hypothetical protein
MIVSAGLYALCFAIPEWPVPAVIAAKLAIVALLPLVLLASGYLARDEKDKLRDIWRTIRSTRIVRSP